MTVSQVSSSGAGPVGPRLGVVVSTRQAVLAAQSVRALVELARVAENLGFASVWAGESITAKPRPDVFSFLSGCAAVTDRIVIGTAAALPALHHPVHFAHQVGTLDQLADGRLIVGVGAGFPGEATRLECELLGVDYSRRRQIMDEVVRATRRHGGMESSAGLEQKDVAASAPPVAPAPVSADGVPFWLGGEGDATKQRCGRYYDGWMPTSATPERLGAGIQTVRDAARGAGRSPSAITVAEVLTIAIDPDARAATTRLRDYLQAYYRTNAPLEQIAEVVGVCAGTARHCADRVREFYEAGADEVIVRFADDDQVAAVQGQGEALLAAM